MQQYLQQIINDKSIETLFQPVLNIAKSEIIGYEALSRGPKDSPLYTPQRLFDTALQTGYLYELEILCRKLAVKQFAKLDLPGYLFLNVNPMVLTNLNYPQSPTLKMLEKSGLDQDRVIIEISENYPIDSPGLLKTTVDRYRNYGFDICIDNLGSGSVGLHQWTELRPDWIKIDRSLVKNCYRDIVKKEFLRTVIDLGKATNVNIVAQGIEEKSEFDQLIELGLTHAQGFLFARPEAFPVKAFPKLAEVAPHMSHISSVDGTLAQLVISTSTCNITAKAGQICKMLSSNQKIYCLPVLDGNKPVGMVMRHQLMEKFSDVYSHALFHSHGIAGFMEKNPLMLEDTTPLAQASLYITEQDDENFSRFFIVTHNGEYLGLASCRELLKRITASKIENARYANPLTLLPGNVPIDREIDYLLESKTPFQLAYVDIDHFKPFNDVFGYSKGDQMIILLSRVIRKCCGKADTFIGHIGGDDFIILFKNTNSQRILATILDEYSEQTLTFFGEAEIDNKGYTAINRNGEQTHFSLPSISIGVVTPDLYACTSHVEVSPMASEAKKQAKKLPGNQVFYCRRSHPFNVKLEDKEYDKAAPATA